ncbi:glycoside hydrolase superfamily, partial [Baffinella frigidus]
GVWGHNPRTCLAIHPPYGTPDDLRAFVDKAHSLGLAVMVDIVLNHGSSRLNCLWNWDGYGPDNNGGIYFDKGGGDTPWGKKFALDRREVQEYLMFFEPSTLNHQPSTINPQPSTFNPPPSTLYPQPSTLNPQPSTPNLNPPKPQTLNPRS